MDHGMDIAQARNLGPRSRRILIGLVAVFALFLLWPFYSVPTGSRGVVTQFGKIVGIEGEGLAVLPPWEKLSNFSIRAEQADIENAKAEALRVQNAALAQNKDVLELRRIEVERTTAEKWNGVLPAAIHAGAPIPFLNVGK